MDTQRGWGVQESRREEHKEKDAVEENEDNIAWELATGTFLPSNPVQMINHLYIEIL